MNNKATQIHKIKNIIKELDLKIKEINSDKPWGAYLRLEDSDAERFIDTYFPDIKEQFGTFEGLSPKYLLVEPGQRLSWQYHFNRAEHWRVIEGIVGIKLSDSDIEPPDSNIINTGGLVQFPAQKRHRLIGLDDWGVVVEIWQHTNPNKPSNESDIIRVADDYNR